MIRICENTKCDNELKEGQRHYCSRACFFEGMKKSIKRTCKLCGREFEIKPWELKRQGRKGDYCSIQHWAESRIGSIRLDLRKRVTKICPVCGDQFETGGRAGKLGKTFCPKPECRNRARYRHGVISKELEYGIARQMAGLVDGEGSIILYMRGDVVCLRLMVANTKIVLLEWIREQTGFGAIVSQTRSNPKHKIGHQWIVNSEGAESVIKQIRPYLIIKQAQANLALETQERLRDPSLKSDRSWQSDYYYRMKALNKRGSVES